ncbi:MAG TPA: hypothetical protein VI875_02105 [Candidatus Norongarragalinales archaeon]|nr:hypothetical protein [Candidatus Norongarragalinales archaeon]
MLSFNPPKVRIGVKEITLDHAGDFSFISHAHSDHALKTRVPSILASEATVDLLKARGYASGESVVHEHYGTKLLGAGHVLGARQLVAAGDEGVVAYTGDFRLSDSLCVKGAEIPQCDTLLMEATFGSPEFVFPDRESVAKEIASWVTEKQKEGMVVLGGYALGKAQELTKILNDYAGIAPVVDESIAKINDVYVKHGVALDYVRSSSDEGLKELEKNFVAIVPMNRVNNNFAFQLSRAYSKKVSAAVATGWALTERFGSMQKFCLSDHSDFPELVEFAEQTGAKKIYTEYGSAKRLARELRKKGLNAHALEEQQKLLMAWGE